MLEPISTVIPEITICEGRAVTTSVAIANFFGKQHKHVLAKIDSLECSPAFTSANFSAHVQQVEIGNGASRESKYYEITKDGFVFLVMGFTGKKAARFKEAYIAEFNRMEAELHKQPENSFILGAPRTLVIHFDESGQISYTEKAPEGAVVTTFDRFQFYAEKNGYLVIHRDNLKTMTLEQLVSFR